MINSFKVHLLLWLKLALKQDKLQSVTNERVGLSNPKCSFFNLLLPLMFSRTNPNAATTVRQ